jgi:Flp pilus assembly pilin Flp
MNALLSMYVYVKSMFEVEEGQDLIEYALIIGLVVIAAVVALTAFGTDISTFLGDTAAKLPY